MHSLSRMSSGDFSFVVVIIFLLNLAINLQQSDCYVTQHTLNLLLHYLVK